MGMGDGDGRWAMGDGAPVHDGRQTDDLAGRKGSRRERQARGGGLALTGCPAAGDSSSRPINLTPRTVLGPGIPSFPPSCPARDINYLPSASASRNALDHEQEESPDGEMPRVPSEAIASSLSVRGPGWPSWLAVLAGDR